MDRKNISSGTPWEPLIGYSRAVRIANRVLVSGTTSVDSDGNVIGVDDPYIQTRTAIEIIRKSLEQAGSNISHVVRTRMFVKDISRWQEFAEAHREAFGLVRPANSFVEVSRLLDPRMLIEIEAEAVIPDDQAG
jgi:enamine deaminase RidA (YjgF/YER057c/UK114 family)